MNSAFVIVTLVAIVFNGFSGVAALAHFAPIMPGMTAAGVPVSWLRFPIGTLKVLGALGLLAGFWLPPLGIAAAAGLVIYFICAMYTHVLAKDISIQFGLATSLLALNVAALTLAIMTHPAIL